MYTIKLVYDTVEKTVCGSLVDMFDVLNQAHASDDCFRQLMRYRATTVEIEMNWHNGTIYGEVVCS